MGTQWHINCFYCWFKQGDRSISTFFSCYLLPFHWIYL